MFIFLVSAKEFQSVVEAMPPDVLHNQNIILTNIPSKEMNHLVFPINSQVFSYQKLGNQMTVLEHYNIGNQAQTVHTVGWYESSQLVFTSQSLLERRKDLNGLQLRAEALPEFPWTLQAVNGKTKGVIGDLWHGIIEKSLNFTTVISAPPDGNWGSVNDSGVWNGMVGGLLENRMDIALASLYKTSTRGQVIDFSVTFDVSFIGLYVKFPSREASWTTFLDPFHIHVWVSLVFLLFILIVSFYASYYLGPEKFLNRNSFTFSQTPFVVWCSMIAQGTSLDPKSTSAKIIFLLCFLLGLLVISSFNATLTSYLAVFKLSLPFLSLEGILETEYSIGGLSGATYDGFFLAPEGSIKRRVADQLMKPNPDTKLKTYEEAHNKILNERFAFIYSSQRMNGKNNDNCLFAKIPGDVGSFQVALGFPKKFIYASLLNQAIKQSNENGQMDRILKKWVVKPRADCVSGSAFESMGIDNVISAFAIIGVAVVISLLVLSVEIYRRKTCNAKNTQLKEVQSFTLEDSRLLCEECKKCIY